MQFQFATAAKIVFGPGTVNDVPSFASGMGRHALLLTGKNAGRAEGLKAGLVSAGLSVTLFPIGSEPIHFFLEFKAVHIRHLDI